MHPGISYPVRANPSLRRNVWGKERKIQVEHCGPAVMTPSGFTRSNKKRAIAKPFLVTKSCSGYATLSKARALKSLFWKDLVFATHSQQNSDHSQNTIGSQQIGVRDLPLRNMISLGAWRMGLGCSGKILPSSPSPSPPSLTRVWEGGSHRFYYDFGASGMRGSIRLVFRVPTDRILRKVVVGKPHLLNKTDSKTLKTAENDLT